nr:MAG TPA: hypothetical protein [Caudoviricetes sp.]
MPASLPRSISPRTRTTAATPRIRAKPNSSSKASEGRVRRPT